MAYQLHYWQSGAGKDTYYEQRCVRLKSIEEAYPLSLEHNRPSGCTLITVDRSDKESNTEKIIWEK